MRNFYRMPAGAAEEVRADPSPTEKAPPTKADRERRLKVAAAAIAGSSWPAHTAAENIVKAKYGGMFEPKLEELESRVDESIAVLLIAIEQWKAAR